MTHTAVPRPPDPQDVMDSRPSSPAANKDGGEVVAIGNEGGDQNLKKIATSSSMVSEAGSPPSLVHTPPSLVPAGDKGTDLGGADRKKFGSGTSSSSNKEDLIVFWEGYEAHEDGKNGGSVWVPISEKKSSEVAKERTHSYASIVQSKNGLETQHNIYNSADTDLEKLSDAWPSLSEGVKASNKRDVKEKHISTTKKSEQQSLPPPSEKSRNRFSWAAKMNPVSRNLYRVTEPTYLEDDTPKIIIPTSVFQEGLENQKEYIIGQFHKCSVPPGGLTHAIVNHIWGRNCKIFTKKLSESAYLFHIPDARTRSWVLQRSLWHVDDCLMFVAEWSPITTLELPKISTVPVWVTLRNIPTSLYSIKALSWIASGLGEPMLSYKPRLEPTEIGKAKVMVEVELSKPFPQKVLATDLKGNSSLIDVEYAWIPTKCKGCGHLGHKLSRCLSTSKLEAKTRDETSTKVLENDMNEVNVTLETSTNAIISNAKGTTAMKSTTQSGTPSACVKIVTNSETSSPLEDNIKAQQMIKATKEQDAQQNEEKIHGSSSKDNQVEEKILDNREETRAEISNELTAGKDPVYSSCEDTFDENQALEETLQRKLSRSAKPTMKAREMQGSGNKGRRGKGQRGRGHR